MRKDKKTVVTLAVGAAVLLELVLVGAARLGRTSAAREIDAARACRAEFERLLAHAEKAQEPAAAEPEPFALLETADVAGTLELLQGLGEDAGIVLDAVKAGSTSTSGKQSFQLAGRGTPENVCTFLASLEAQRRLVVAESGRVLPGGPAQLAFELTLATWHTQGDR